VLAFIRHRANIQRLIAGTESKAFTKKTPKS
jgi:glycerol-3-phosphate acyltransferase PlsY